MSSEQTLSWERFEPSLKEMMARLSPDELENFSEDLLAAHEAAKRDRLSRYKPYPKQMTFHLAGASNRERLLMASNQSGKTWAGAAEAAYHATGLYPEWWTGRKFNKATVGWVSGVTGLSTRDTAQRVLLGRPGEHGTGMLPGRCISDTYSARGVADLVDIIHVDHVSGEQSTIGMKSYEQGREKWQGETLDWVWFDEEPPPAIYTEGLTRTNATNGIVWMTFTPLQGMSEVVHRFLIQGRGNVTQMTLDDAEHFTPEKRKEIIASYPAHEVEARTKGIPVMGSGRVFPVTEESIKETGFSIPSHWPRICGIDIGTDHPTAAVWMAHDRDTDTIHVYDCYRVSGEVIAVHASALKARGVNIPVAWPHDALKRDGAKTGLAFAELYRREGVNMLPKFAQFADDRGFSREAGIAEILGRMRSSRFKVAAHLNDWWEEFRLYHRKDGVIVDERDDLQSATRYGVMMIRDAQEPTPELRLDRLTPKWTRV